MVERMGAHYDNGREFTSGPLLRRRLECHAGAARTRLYHRNGNCFAEQKNFGCRTQDRRVFPVRHRSGAFAAVKENIAGADASFFYQLSNLIKKPLAIGGLFSFLEEHSSAIKNKEQLLNAAALAEVYRWLCPLYNYGMPLFHLVAKEKREDGRYRKEYEKEPGTPYERLMKSPDVSEECKAGLLRRKEGHNPAEVNRSLSGTVEKLLMLLIFT